MAKKAALFLGLAFAALLASAQDGSGGLIEGDRWAFLVSAPEGWILDAVPLRHQGIQGLFHKEGVDFSPSALHMYVCPTTKKPDGAANLREFIQEDEAAFMKSAPGLVIRMLPAYSTAMDYNFPLRDFDDAGEGFYQEIAYYEAEEAYFVFVLFCRSALEREGERPSFRELLDSFTYIRKE